MSDTTAPSGGHDRGSASGSGHGASTDDVPTAEARKNLAEILNRVAYGKERVIVTRHGKELAAIVPVEELDLLDRVKRFAGRRDVTRALRELEEGDAVSWEELRERLDL